MTPRARWSPDPRLVRTVRHLLAAVILAVALAGLAASLVLAASPLPNAYPRQEPFVVRPYDVVREGRWAGNGIAYGMHRDGQRPGGPLPSRAQILEDLRLLAPRWSTLRVYGSIEPTETVLRVIRDEKLDLRVLLGVWIDAEEERDSTAHAFRPRRTAILANHTEMDDAVRLAERYPGIVQALCVGNETQVAWSAHKVPPELLVHYLREARARTGLPVASADDYNFWNKPESGPIARECDFLVLHAHPLWNGKQVAEAMAWTDETLAEARTRHPDRLVVLGETGWATQRGDTGDEAKLMKGELGEGPQAAFLDSLDAWMGRARVPVFYFEAFDENWKGGDRPDEVEKHWGLYRANRTPKQAVARPR